KLGDEASSFLEQVRGHAGPPQASQAAPLRGEVGAGGVEEGLEAATVVAPQRLARLAYQFAQHPPNKLADEVVLGGKATVERSHADSGDSRHFLNASIQPSFGKHLTGRLEHPLPVLGGIPAQGLARA